jgi:hypothetical protein
MMENLGSIGFAQRQRLQYIESVAYWEGKVDRPRVSRVFEMSDNHITKDFTIYRNAFPDNLVYDVSGRYYRPSRDFEPQIASGSPEEYLALLRAFHETKVTGLPPVGSGIIATGLPIPSGQVDPKVLREMTRALSQEKGLRIQYQSFTTEEPTIREIWPHALVFAGLRWHIRAYDGLRKSFVDLVLLRVLQAEPIQASSPVNSKDDDQWHDTEHIQICPVDTLSKTQKSVIAAEYGMSKSSRGKWSWEYDVRKCLVAYLLVQLRLDLNTSVHPYVQLSDPKIAERFSFSASRDMDKLIQSDRPIDQS